MIVLYVGSSKGQSWLMQQAMRRRGHEVFGVDPYLVLEDNRLAMAWAWRTGALGGAWLVEQHIRGQVGERRFDIALVDNGELISPRAVGFLRQRARRVALFNRDNPFAPRDGLRWRLLRKALPHYDLYATIRESTVDDASKAGLGQVICVPPFADEVLHQPLAPSDGEFAIYGSPVSFVGTWFPERGQFMEALLRRGVPLRIIGRGWERAENFSALRHAVVAGYLGPEHYAAAVRSSQIAIGMLSKGNRDVQTSRSAEIPAMGVVLCAERTPEHQAMYVEGEEALFWSSADECAELSLGLLADPKRLARMAAAGRQRALRNELWAEPAMERILRATLDGVAP